MPRLTGRTHLVGIIGWPVEHSVSPAIHNAAFTALGLDWAYVPLAVEPGTLPGALAGLSALGFKGANVTMPHKEEAADLLGDSLTEDARLSGAVNTIVAGPGGLAGHNTDVAGFQRFLERDAGFEALGKSAVLFGAGGAARAVLLSLARMGVGSVTIAARTLDRARRLAAMPWAPSTDVLPWDDAARAEAELVVNASPAQGLPDVAMGEGTLVVDLVYRPSDTRIVRSARARGATAFGGLGMLLQQGALSFELWTGQLPPIDVMSAAAVAELGTASDSD
jgi:shikimate dehydrogenase